MLCQLFTVGYNTILHFQGEINQIEYNNEDVLSYMLPKIFAKNSTTFITYTWNHIQLVCYNVTFVILIADLCNMYQAPNK